MWSLRCAAVQGEVTPDPVTDNARIPLLMTRPRAQSNRFVAELGPDLAAALRPVMSPLIEIAPLEPDLTLAQDEAVIFSSVNGVATAPEGAGRRAYCVGDATTQAARDRGWQADCHGDSARALLDDLLPRALPPLVHLSGVHTRGRIAQTLAEAGHRIRHVALYDQARPPLTDEAKALLTARKPLLVPLFSPRTAEHFAAQAPDTAYAHIISFSETVDSHLGNLPAASRQITSAPTAQAMRAALAMRLRRLDMG